MQYQDMREQLQNCIRQAGVLAMSYYGCPLTRVPKKNGFATQADIAVEQFLIQSLGAIAPEASFYAEESGQSGNHHNGYCWVIDPIDGTTNFARSIPYFCISVALTFNGEPVVGIIYQPVLDELFYAQQGSDAWLNGIRLSKQSDQSGIKLVVASPWSSSRKPVKRGYAPRYFGAVALDCAYLASGKIDGLEFSSVFWWDIAAGILMLKEAGVPVTVTKRTAGDQEVYRVIAGDTGKP